MSALEIYIDINFPKKLVDALISIHNLQRKKQYQIIHWIDQEIPSAESGKALLLMVNEQKRGLEIPILKHYEEGYKVIACKAGNVTKPDLFEFAMTVLRVWPRIIEVSEKEHDPFLYTFTYSGKKLSKAKN